MKWFKRNWPFVLYAITAINYVVLICVQYFLGKKLDCALFLPDLSPFFSAEAFNEFRSCLTSNSQLGLKLFGQFHTFGADLIFPALFATSLTLLTYRNANVSPRFANYPTIVKIIVTALMPTVYAISDYFENTLVWQWLVSVQSNAPTSGITNATTLKFTSLAIALAILLLFALASLKNRRNNG